MVFLMTLFLMTGMQVLWGRIRILCLLQIHLWPCVQVISKHTWVHTLTCKCYPLHTSCTTFLGTAWPCSLHFRGISIQTGDNVKKLVSLFVLILSVLSFCCMSLFHVFILCSCVRALVTRAPQFMLMYQKMNDKLQLSESILNGGKWGWMA